jgi:hypothetical protein
MSKRLDLCFPAGTTQYIPVSFEVGCNNPTDISAAVITMTCKTDPYAPDANALWQISTTSGDILILDGPAGSFAITIPATATAGLGGLLANSVYSLELEIGPTPSYSGFSGFNGYSGKGKYRNVVIWGDIHLVPNSTSA